MDHDPMRNRLLKGVTVCGAGATVLLGGWALSARSQEQTTPEPAPAPGVSVEVRLRVYACPADTPPPAQACKLTYGTPELPTAYACPAKVKLADSACRLQPVMDQIEGARAGVQDSNGSELMVECPGDARCP